MKLKLFTFASLAAIVALASANSARAAVIVDGPSFQVDSNLTLTAVQGIDAANTSGQSALVIQNFEDPNTFGVQYQQSNGGTKDFGLGLYQGAGNAVESTGLKGTFGTAVIASSVTLTVSDFDINSLSQGFKTGKVEPNLSIFASDGSLIGTTTPSQFLANMTAVAGQKDVWNVNLGSVLTTLGSNSNTSISGYLLSADSANGEKGNSDPYELISAGQGTTPPPSVPETSTFLPLLGVLGMVVVVPRLRRKRVAA